MNKFFYVLFLNDPSEICKQKTSDPKKLFLSDVSILLQSRAEFSLFFSSSPKYLFV